jgi:pimeloyl-ACP methyl ester carboxylesterase
MISRRRFTQALAAGVAATSLGGCSPQAPTAAGPDLREGSGRYTSLGPVKHVEAGVLDVAYAEFGPATGRPVVLLHGWPYDAGSYADVGRLGLAPGEPQYDAYEEKLATAPAIAVPAITIGSDFDGAAADGAPYRAKFTGKYDHRVLAGIGHNVPQEAPRPFARAVVDADRL